MTSTKSSLDYPTGVIIFKFLARRVNASIDLMKRMPSMVEVMTPMPHTVEAEGSLADAIRIMYAQGFRHLPVTSAGKLIGILSDRDCKLAVAVCKGKIEESELRVDDVCVLDPYVVKPEDKLDTVVEYMFERHIGSALVSSGNKVVGIFTSTDACRVLFDTLKVQYPDA